MHKDLELVWQSFLKQFIVLKNRKQIYLFIFICLVIVFKLQFLKTRFSIVFKNSGLGYLRLWAEDCRIALKEVVFGV